LAQSGLAALACAVPDQVSGLSGLDGFSLNILQFLASFLKFPQQRQQHAKPCGEIRGDIGDIHLSFDSGMNESSIVPRAVPRREELAFCFAFQTDIDIVNSEAVTSFVTDLLSPAQHGMSI
jgi:hypothetical protein